MRKWSLFAFLLTGVTALYGQETGTHTNGTKISFQKEIMPILTKRCLNCHNSEDEGPSGLYMDNYKYLMKGESKHGPVILPGKGEESTLIKKLRGTESFGARMPRSRTPLPDSTIEKISQWITQGAKNN